MHVRHHSCGQEGRAHPRGRYGQGIQVRDHCGIRDTGIRDTRYPGIRGTVSLWLLLIWIQDNEIVGYGYGILAYGKLDRGYGILGCEYTE